MASKSKKRKVEDEDKVPEEIEEQCLDCHHSLANIEKILKPLLPTSRTVSEEKLSNLDNASLTLTLCYTINSLFWVYLTTQGVNPKSHNIKTELERIQKYMQRTNVTSERLKGEVPHVNKEAAKRFVKNALWDEEVAAQSSKKRSRDETN